jgi:hypothetical protein
MNNKRGMSHIEMVLSFIIFVGFLIFLFAIFKPLRGFSQGEVYLDILERNIKNYTKIEVKFLTLNINENISSECFHFRYNSSLDNITERDANYNFVQSFCEGVGGGQGRGDVKPREIWINGTGNFFYIYFCDEFRESEFDAVNCKSLNKKDYSLGLYRSYNMTSYNKLEELEKEYANNYDELKGKFGLPSSKDFSFNVLDSSRNSILRVQKTIPRGVRVLARSEDVQLVYKNGTFKYAILNMKLW